jgi:hypothetical protein
VVYPGNTNLLPSSNLNDSAPVVTYRILGFLAPLRKCLQTRHPNLQPDFANAKQEFTTTLLTPSETFLIWSLPSKIDKEKEPDNRININDNPDLQLKIIQGRHDSPLGGHFGITKTYDLISCDFIWDNMQKDIKKFVASCETCQRNKNQRHLPYGLLMPLPRLR